MSTAAVLADLILAVHVGIVLFIVGAQALFVVGAWRGWAWIQNWPLRLTHLLLIGFVVVQTWAGELCPLTIWEQDLRRAAGQATHSDSFIGWWLGELLYIDAPWWAFTAVYTAFFALVVATWWWAPPRRRPPR
jgi:hypothetical protein